MTFLPHFSHLYIESGAEEYDLTKKLCDKYKRSIKVEIKSYKELFNRSRQRWEQQRNALKLILAVRRDNFLYEGSHYVPRYEHARFRYNTSVLNCLYGCEYCYLRGMFLSPNIVVFVNIEDFISKAAFELSEEASYLCVSYDTDLLAFENLLGYCAKWIEFAHMYPNILIEIRTKSANFRSIQHILPCENLILAWTLSPSDVVIKYEHNTPSLSARLTSINEAINKGWKVRLCVDPVLLVEAWQEKYKNFIDEIFSFIDPVKLHDVSIGAFRINSEYLKNMRSKAPESLLVNYNFQIKDGSASYLNSEQTNLIQFVSTQMERYVPKEKVCQVKWQ